jgi:hypothetical protein
MGRFDSPELVAAWSDAGVYPAIHDAMHQWVRETIGPRDGTVLDLCSSTGLLARRLGRAGYRTVAVTQPGPALTLARDAGVYDHTPVLGLRIGPSELPVLDGFMREHQVRTVVARRAFPELWDALGETDFRIMAELWVDAGVRNVLLEGRVASARSTHPLATAAAEAEALASAWKVADSRGPQFHLVPR